LELLADDGIDAHFIGQPSKLLREPENVDQAYSMTTTSQARLDRHVEPSSIIDGSDRVCGLASVAHQQLIDALKPVEQVQRCGGPADR
jgi:hypothetical protein